MNVLIWKEAREIRWVFLYTLGGILGITLLSRFLDLVGFSIFFLFFLAIYSAFIGARSYSSEKGNNSYDYLLTRPVSLRKILWVKYITGLVQIIVLGCIIYILCELYPKLWNIIYNQYSLGFLDAVLLIIMMFSLYTVCFQVSLFTGDTVRGILIGVPIAIVLYVIIIYGSLLQGLTFTLGIAELYKFQLLINFICLWILLVGVLGVIYYSHARKRLVWRTGFLVLLFLPGLIIFYFNREFHGTIKSLSNTHTYSFYKSDIYYKDNQLYGIGRMAHAKDSKGTNKNDSPSNHISIPYQLIKMDVRNPKDMNPTPLFEILFPQNIKYDGDYAYTFGSDLSNRFQVIKYNLKGPGDTPDIHFFAITNDMNPSFTIADKTLRIDGNNLYLTYGLMTGKIINGLEMRNGIPTDSSMYKLHTLVYDKTTWNKVNEYDESFSSLQVHYRQDYGNYSYILENDNKITIYNTQGKNNPISAGSLVFPSIKKDSWTNPFHQPSLLINDRISDYKIYGNRLYVTTLGHPLEIYDLTDPAHPQQIGTMAWDWIDQLVLHNRHGLFWEGKVFVSGNRAIVFYFRGFIVYDITDPTHPHEIQKMNSDFIVSSTLEHNYIYTSGFFRGFSVYRIP